MQLYSPYIGHDLPSSLLLKLMVQTKFSSPRMLLVTVLCSYQTICYCLLLPFSTIYKPHLKVGITLFCEDMITPTKDPVATPLWVTSPPVQIP